VVRKACNPILSEAVTIDRDLAARDPGASSDLAPALNGLGPLYLYTGRPADAEKAYSEALTIYRDLAAHDPSAYRPTLAITLNSLGTLYFNTGRPADAEKAYSEALAIYRDLAAKNPGARPALATTLNTVGALYFNTGRPGRRRQSLKRGAHDRSRPRLQQSGLRRKNRFTH
jgi:tetratricopeptide (TPR) repeat protein